MAAERVFIDTNILVYANQFRSPFHDAALSRLGSLAERELRLCISLQVMREFYNALTRPQTAGPAFEPGVAVERLRSFQSVFAILPDTPQSLGVLLEIAADYGVSGKQIHDANIVATRAVHGIRRLLTANPSDFRRFADLIDIEPL